ncbi:MAG: preprotein translocase subunit SecG [Chloroflexi bacterium]|nr:preprotein translocase subunit SecG [Chloroflexota bacterium]
MTFLILGIHSILAVLLVVLILLHSGKGGVSGIFGGGMSDTFSGTSVIEKNLTRVTVLVATAFFITTSLLVFVPALRA